MFSIFKEVILTLSERGEAPPPQYIFVNNKRLQQSGENSASSGIFFNLS